MSDLSLPVRVTAARRLLEGGVEGHDALHPQCRAFIEESIEFLTLVEEELAGGDGKN